MGRHVGQMITCPYKRDTGGQRVGGCYAAGFEGRGRGFELVLKVVSRSWTGREAGSPESLQSNVSLCAHLGLRPPGV